MLDVWYFGDLKIEFIELIVDYRLIIDLFNVIEIVLRISFVDKEDSFIYFSFFFCKLDMRFWFDFVRVRFSPDVLVTRDKMVLLFV